MFKRNRSKKSKLFRKYLISYLAVMLLCLVIVLVAYNMSVKIIEVEITNAHYKSLIQIKNISESILKELEIVYIQIGFDEKIQMLMSLSPDMGPEQLIEMAKLEKELKTYCLSYPVIKDIYLYFERSDTVLSNYGRHRLDIFRDSVFNYDPDIFTEWINSEDIGMDVFAVADDAGQEKNIMAYIRTLPVGRRDNFLGKLIVVVEEENINEEMDKFEWIEQGTRFVIDRENEVFLESENYRPDPDITFESLTSDTVTDAKGNMVLSYIASDNYDWKYVYLIPKNIFFEKAKKVKTAIEICFLIVLCLGFFLSYFFAKRYYEPIDKLIVFIQNNLKRLKKKDEDEYNFIKAIIANALNEREEYQEKADKLSERLRNDFLIRLVRGGLKKAAIEDIKDIHNVIIDDETFYSVVMVYLDDVSLLHYEDPEEYGAEENLELARLIIRNTMEELLANKYPSIYAKDGDSNVFIIGLGRQDTVQAENELWEIVDKFTDIIKNRFKIGIFSSFSCCQKGYDGIKNAFGEANKNMEYYLLLGREQEGRISLNKQEKSNVLNFDFNKDIEQFKQSILAREIGRAEALLKEIFGKWFSADVPLSANTVKYRMSEIRNTLINAIENLVVYSESDFAGFPETTDRLYNCKNIEGLKTEAADVLENLNRYMAEKDRSEPDLAQKAIRYINQNFSDCDMNISMIAHHLGVNAPHLSRQFKKSIGIGPLEYLQLKRVEEAKNLLMNSSESIKDITRKVGFIYEVSFFRVFKKFEGVTPGIFRNGS